MKLVNCPVCGERCSAEAEKCPECGFEIKSYFNDSAKNSGSRRPKYAIIIGIIALAVIAIIIITVCARKAVTNTTDKSEVVSLDNIFPEPDEASETPSESSSVSVDLLTEENEVSGVYSGDDGEILVMDSDGLAYYYCISIENTELECPWYVKDNTVYIELARLHCTIYAETGSKDLLFRSDSINWNPELFTKLNVSPDQYLTRALSTHDPDATLNRDGTITYTLDDITYTLPKTFVDFQDDFDEWDFCSAFIDNDPQSNYLGTILFYRKKGSSLSEGTATKLITDFAPDFLNDSSVGSCTATTIAGHQAYICEVTGYLNQGFSMLQNYPVSGYIAVLYNESTGNNDFIMAIQNSDRDTDNSLVFGDILKSAR